MQILVTYATKYGATQGIAERIADTLKAEGLDVDVEPVADVKDLARYDAFMIGSAAYIGSWLKEAKYFVEHNLDVLAAKPVWLFSSGPIGTATVDKKGRDVLVTSEPKEFAEFATTLKPRDQRVFFGALDSKKLRGVYKLFSLAPASERTLIEGDFRDWDLIDEWARSVAHELTASPATAR